MRPRIFSWYSGICLFLFSFQVLGQERDVTIDVGKSRLTLQDELIFQITLENGPKRSQPGLIDFPQLPGFKKDLQKRSFPIRVEEGKRKQIDLIQQKYVPEKPGVYQFPQFEIVIDNQSFVIAPRRVTVIDSIPGLPTRLPRLPGKDAFLATTLSTERAFVGEEVVVEIAVFIPKQTNFEWDFPPDLSDQIERMAQKLKPLDCLENRVLLSSVTAEDIRLTDQDYTKYQLYLSRYIPLKAGKLVFPGIEFKPLRKMRGEAAFKPSALKSARETVSILPLPEHPLRDKVAVGPFVWTEKVYPKRVEVGKPVTYEAKIQGSSSLWFATWPTPVSDEWFDFFPEPAMTKSVVGPVRSFRFQLIPKKNGQVALNRYFQFFFFHPQKQAYDTLTSRLNLVIQGDTSGLVSQKLRPIDIYDGLAEKAVPEQFINIRYWSQTLANLFIFIIFALATFLFYNRFNPKP